MAEENSRGVEMHDTANGMKDKTDKEKLIENGNAGAKEDSPESQNSYGEVSPLHLDAPSEKKTSDGLKVIIISCVVFAIGVTVALIITIYCAPPQVEPHGAVSSDDKRCSDIGAKLLLDGGSAVDSAIGTLFCLSVVQPESSGIGGGGFMIYRNHKQKITKTINFRETAPKNAKPADLEDKTKTESFNGALVGVPGFLKGMEEAHQKFGKLKWSALIQPSVDLAKNGFNMSENGAKHLQNNTDCNKMAEVFTSAYCRNGVHLKAGDFVKLDNYSVFLEKVAKDGASVMYEGQVAQEIIDMVNQNGGKMELNDLKSYTVIEGEPVTSIFKNMSVESLGAPSGGPILLFILNLLDTFDPVIKDYNTSLYYHRYIEAVKFSNALDEYFGDPAFSTAVTNNVTDIISADFAKKIAAKINDSSTQPEAFYFTALGLQPRAKRAITHTTHVSVIGPHEDHVAITSSLNYNFGSKLITPSGIILNNQLLDFDKPSQPHSNPNNQMKAGARPQSHMAPTVAHSRERPCGLRLATGAVGGWSITSEIAFTMVNLLAFNQTIAESIEAPRIYYDRIINKFLYEAGISQSIIQDLQNKGHQLTPLSNDQSTAVVNSVMKINETVSAHADSRRGGVANVF